LSGNPTGDLCLSWEAFFAETHDMLEIINISAGSIAEELGLETGDSLLSVNGVKVVDILDYLLEEPREELLLEVKKADGEVWELELDHDSDDPLGLELQHPDPRHCGNNCVFCFVHQLPRGMRKTLYVKDEDYRFSYLYGAYVTLTNLSDSDLQRIIEKKLSPLYVSVHATDNGLREKLLGKKAPAIMPLMQQLVDGGIELHTQIVVCPEINDGEALQKTFEDIVSLGPAVKTLAIVPVGLTGHRDKLYSLRVQTRTEAEQLVDWVEQAQQKMLSSRGTRFVFAADELYLKAQKDFPALESYEDLAQIENGVGLIALFRAQAKQALDGLSALSLPQVSLVTAVSASNELKFFIDELSARTGADLHLHVVTNDFFSGQVTVAGLVTGSDVVNQLKNQSLGRVLLIPDVMLREGEDVFLDDVRISDLAEALSVEVEVVPSTPWGIVDMLETLADEDWGQP
jgi:putative radical SAM enzyme (TIGR03279 family)